MCVLHTFWRPVIYRSDFIYHLLCWIVQICLFISYMTAVKQNRNHDTSVGLASWIRFVSAVPVSLSSGHQPVAECQIFCHKNNHKSSLYHFLFWCFWILTWHLLHQMAILQFTNIRTTVTFLVAKPTACIFFSLMPVFISTSRGRIPWVKNFTSFWKCKFVLVLACPFLK